MDYNEFLHNKSQLAYGKGFTPVYIPDFLFDFQKHLVEWALTTGRAAMFADCGMGKTPMQLVWADNVVKHTNKPVLVMAPLMVSQQTTEEAAKFGIDAVRSMDGKFLGARVIVTNYERLHHFDPTQFSGVVCDESSCIKNFDGVRKSSITEFMRKTPYRLLCTATAAPNDHIELGTTSEALGYLGYMDMLSMFFKNDEDSLHPAFIGSKWRFKSHAESAFWRWVTSWARACTKPSDLGFEDGRFVLPALNVTEHEIDSPAAEGHIFAMAATNLNAQREDAKLTLEQRCELAATILSGDKAGIAWGNLNAETDLLARLIPGAIQISGADSDEGKEEKLVAFKSGQARVVVTKPKIAAFGMNWQHCSNMTYFPTHSFEQYYQAIRRCWRFGQKDEVNVNLVISSGQAGVMHNLKRKADACEDMFKKLVSEMNNATNVDRVSKFTKQMELPKWL